MNEEQNRWRYQYSSNVGAKEFFRLGCAIVTWLLIGMGISVAFELAGYSWGSTVFTIFFIAMFGLAIMAPTRRLGYLLLREIIGNENLPKEPYPRSKVKIPREPRRWWSYLPGVWFSLMTFLALYFAIEHLLK